MQPAAPDIVPAAPLPPAAPTLSSLKQRQQQAWSSGDYAVVGTTLQIVGEQLCESLDLRSGSRVLDVAAGNGNASLAAARRGADVVSTDYVPALLEAGRRRAEAEGLPVAFETADAEALPYADGAFDVVLSTFGVMFTPDHARAGDELLRVCRPGGAIGLANWTPDGFVGRMFERIAAFLPPPPQARPPSRWGEPDYVAGLFGARATIRQATPREFNFRYRSARHWLEVFRTWYGPMARAFDALPPPAALELAVELLALAEDHNRAGDGSLVVPATYLEVVAIRH